MHLLRNALPGSPGDTLMIVIGVGNRFRGDDAVGLRVVERLGTAVTCYESDGDPSNLIVLFGSDPDVIIVDAMVSGAEPGTVRATEIALTSEEEPRVPLASQRSTHGFGVFEALELARILGTVPHRLTVIGVEGARFDPGAELTPELEEAACRVADRILRIAAEQKV